MVSTITSQRRTLNRRCPGPSPLRSVPGDDRFDEDYGAPVGTVLESDCEP